MLATPARTKRNYRAYSAQHLARLRFIRRARALGFSIEQVQELLKLADQKDISCSDVDAIAREHLAEIDRKLRDLNTLRAELSSVIVQCRNGTISDCRIIEALAPDPAALRYAGTELTTTGQGSLLQKSRTCE